MTNVKRIEINMKYSDQEEQIKMTFVFKRVLEGRR